MEIWSRTNRGRRTGRMIGSFACAATVILGLTAPATATPVAGNTWVATPDGVIGMQQTVIARTPKLKGSVVTIAFISPSGATTSGQAPVNSSGFAYLPWVPSSPGQWTVLATNGTTTLDTSVFTVAAMPTTTTLLVPHRMVSGVANLVTVNVQALAGDIAPSGTVTVRNQASTIVATGGISATGSRGLSSVNLNVTPPSGTTSLTATYSPSTTAFRASTSPTQTPVIGVENPVTLLVPSTYYVGQPAQLQATIGQQYFSSVGGTTAFSLQIGDAITYPMGGSQPIVNGTSTVTWVPTQTGTQTLKVQYASSNNAIAGNDSQEITVQAAPSPDTTTITPTGSSPWTSTIVGSFVRGSNLVLMSTTKSGNPAQLSVDGPCVLEANSLTLLAAGTCLVNAQSLGNGGSFTPASQTYVLTAVAKPKKKKKRT